MGTWSPFHDRHRPFAHDRRPKGRRPEIGDVRKATRSGAADARTATWSGAADAGKAATPEPT
jgi:hypothetical protein